jgi:hypothetical protein
VVYLDFSGNSVTDIGADFGEYVEFNKQECDLKLRNDIDCFLILLLLELVCYFSTN